MKYTQSQCKYISFYVSRVVEHLAIHPFCQGFAVRSFVLVGIPPDVLEHSDESHDIKSTK